MAYGLACYDADGNTLFDSTINTTRVLGSFDTSGDSGSKVITVPEGFELWAVVNYVKYVSLSRWGCTTLPLITVSGNTISWQRTSTPSGLGSWTNSLECNIIYGVK